MDCLLYTSDEWMDKVRDAQPEFRDEKKVRYKEEYDLPDYDIDIILSLIHILSCKERTTREGRSANSQI